MLLKLRFLENLLSINSKNAKNNFFPASLAPSKLPALSLFIILPPKDLLLPLSLLCLTSRGVTDIIEAKTEIKGNKDESKHRSRAEINPYGN